MTELAPLNNAHLPVRLRLEDYLHLDAAGAFAAYRKTELIDGEILFMNAQHRPHAVIKSRLHVRLAAALDRIGQGLEAVVEGSIAIPPQSSPEPDLVVTGSPDGEGLIPLDSVRLVIEVADATLAFDLRSKRSLYARSGIREYWVVDVEHRIVHQMWSPAGETYDRNATIALGEPVTAATIPGLTIATAGL